MGTCDGLRKWFRLPERLVIFTFGLLFSKGMMTYVLCNFMTFLTDSWNLKLKKAAAIVNLQDGLRDMLQIHVALCIDAWLGYRWMLILSSVLYSAGLGLLAFSAPQYFFNNIKEDKCPDPKEVQCFKKLMKHTPFWEGLALLIAGGAAQVIPLFSLSIEQTKVAPEHYEETRERVGWFPCKGWQQLRQRIIRWFCIIFTMLGVATSVKGFISFENKWHQRFLISAIVIVIGLLWFLCGLPFYGPPRLQTSPLSTMRRVLIAAARKRHLNYRENSVKLHCGDGEENLVLTGHLAWLNNAAIKESPADDNSTMEEQRWRLCTVKEVEQTKLRLNIIPMSVTLIPYGMVQSLGNTFFVEQVNANGDYQPLFLFQLCQLFISKYLANKGFKYIFGKRIERMQRQYSDGVKIGLVMLASAICCGVASLVESERLKALKEGRLSNYPEPSFIHPYWFLPQFCLLGVMDGLAGDGIQEFFCHYAAYSSSYGLALSRLFTGFGTLLSIGFIAILDYYSKSKYKTSWLGDSINQSRLDLIYRAYTFLALLNCFIYACVSTRYSYNNISGVTEEQDMEISILEA